jgi:DHA1 family inner membrane transport protein
MVARVVIGAVQGLFIAAALTTATSLVPAERAGSAMAVVISGFATASAFGLPVGTLLGHVVGWRGSFVAVVTVGAIVLAVAVGVLPSVPTSPASRTVGQARHAFAPRVLAVLGLCFLIFTAVQSVLTYLVPFLTRVTGVSAAGVSVFLLMYGVATTVGSMGGGRFADANASRSLVIGTVGLTASLVAMNLFGASALLAAVCVLAMGLFAMGMAPSMQHRVVTLAGPGAPLASSLPASAVNAGIAFGSFVGGVAIAGWGVSATVVAGVLVAALSVCAAWATSHLHPSGVPADVEPVGAP